MSMYWPQSVRMADSLDLDLVIWAYCMVICQFSLELINANFKFCFKFTMGRNPSDLPQNCTWIPSISIAEWSWKWSQIGRWRGGCGGHSVSSCHSLCVSPILHTKLLGVPSKSSNQFLFPKLTIIWLGLDWSVNPVFGGCEYRLRFSAGAFVRWWSVNYAGYFMRPRKSSFHF